MPWPIGAHDDVSVSPSSLSYDTWLVNDIDFGWLIDCDGKLTLLIFVTCMTYFSVFIAQIFHSKTMDGETWITSDGRAYFVDLRGYSEPADIGLDGACAPQVSRTIMYLGPMSPCLSEIRILSPMLNLQTSHYGGMGPVSTIFRYRSGFRSNDELSLRYRNPRTFIRSQSVLLVWPSI